jgi:hypothetical protein
MNLRKAVDVVVVALANEKIRAKHLLHKHPSNLPTPHASLNGIFNNAALTHYQPSVARPGEPPEFWRREDSNTDHGY